MLTQETLKSVLHYDSETGIFTWLPSLKGKGNHPGKIAGSIQNRGYVTIKFLHKSYLAHRLAWLYVHGQFPPEQIDHINGCRTDNSITNLRLANNGQNICNGKKRKNNKSGYKGVHAYRSKWSAQIRKNGIAHHIGVYSTPEEAHEAYCAKAIEMHGEFFHPG